MNPFGSYLAAYFGLFTSIVGLFTSIGLTTTLRLNLQQSCCTQKIIRLVCIINFRVLKKAIRPAMNSIIYIVGLVVIVGAVLSYFGMR